MKKAVVVVINIFIALGFLTRLVYLAFLPDAEIGDFYFWEVVSSALFLLVAGINILIVSK